MEQFAKNVRWDLADLYSSPDDSTLQKDLNDAKTKSLAFEKEYKPLFESLAQNSNGNFDMLGLIDDYKKIVTLVTKPAVYASLYFAEQTNEASRGAFMQNVQDRVTEIETHLLFWNVAWCKLDASKAQAILNQPEIKPHIHYLEDARKYAPFTLSEAEEKILTVKDNTGGSAFSRLFDETINKIPFFIEESGKRVEKTEPEIIALMHSTNRDTRKRASQSLSEGLSENRHLLTFIYNMILADHRSDMKLRNHAHPMENRNLANETDLPTIMGLIKSIKDSYPLVSRYYALKKRLLKLDTLYDYDRYASITAKEEKIDFNTCREIVLNGYHKFSKEAGDIAQEFFDKNWIDAEIRMGKQGGGFCAETTPDLHPYILVNYTGTIRDVMTVAHEMGHGLHQYLSRKVGILESDTPLTMAETASVFGEMLIFEQLLGAETDPKKRLALICGKIDDNFATVYRQIAMTDFELSCHEAGIKDGELSEDAINDFWIKSNRELYGNSVELSPWYKHGWKYIPHFIHTPFYCYAYAFAQLYVLALFQKYKENPEDFIPKYLEMLSLGGSQKPEDLAKIMGIDIRGSGFWNTGIKLLEDLVLQAEELSQ